MQGYICAVHISHISIFLANFAHISKKIHRGYLRIPLGEEGWVLINVECVQYLFEYYKFWGPHTNLRCKAAIPHPSPRVRGAIVLEACRWAESGGLQTFLLILK